MKTFNHVSGRHESIDGADIYYEIIENPGKPVVVLLHGGFENIEFLNPIAQYLSDDYTLIGIDSRGHGKSTLGSKTLTYEQIQNDIETLLKKLSIDTVSLIGFSDGGVVGYRMAARKSINIDKLITIGASWNIEDILAGEELFKSVTPETAREMFCQNYEMYMQLNPQPDFNTLSNALVKMWLDKNESGHPGYEVKKISAPTLLIRGDNDFIISLSSLVELKSAIEGSALFNVPFAEHAVYEEQPEIVEIVLRKFLSAANT